MYQDKKVLINFNDKHLEESSLTMETHFAQFIISCDYDINEWVQSKYDELSKKFPSYGRRKIGDLIRSAATVFFIKNVKTADDF